MAILPSTGWTHAAFAAFLDRNQERVFRFVFRRVDDHHLAEDLTQQTFLNAYSKRSTFDTSRPELPWITTIARNVIADYMRSARAEKRGKLLRLYLLNGDGDGENEGFNRGEPRDWRTSLRTSGP